MSYKKGRERTTNIEKEGILENPKEMWINTDSFGRCFARWTVFTNGYTQCGKSIKAPNSTIRGWNAIKKRD